MSQYLLSNLHDTRCSNSVSSLYDLAAVIVHHGSGAGSGHYTAFGTKNSNWYHFNDSTVSVADPDTVKHCKAYILFYIQREFKLPPMTWKILSLQLQCFKILQICSRFFSIFNEYFKWEFIQQKDFFEARCALFYVSHLSVNYCIFFQFSFLYFFSIQVLKDKQNVPSDIHSRNHQKCTYYYPNRKICTWLLHK